MSKKRLLIVDDDPNEVTLLTEILRQMDLAIDTAESGPAALEAIADNGADIVLLDVVLPGMSGYQVIEEVRANPATPTVQVIVISGLDESEYLDSAIHSGADDFLKKPYSHMELRARIEAARMRLDHQHNLITEREYYRNAAAEEERLTSLVLDQNVSLKDANERIQKLNSELEKANKSLEKLAANDPLSGLLNRRSLFEKIDGDLARSKRHSDPICGVLVDIDNFKSINDTYGHVCGDHVIRELGSIMRSALRRYDYAGRYGGEEFLMVLQNTRSQQAALVAERLRAQVAAADHSCDERKFSVTVSVGVAQFTEEESAEEWIDRADRALYRAKQAGKNRVDTDEADDESSRQPAGAAITD